MKHTGVDFNDLISGVSLFTVFFFRDVNIERKKMFKLIKLTE